MLPHRLQNTNKTGSGPRGIDTPGTLWGCGVSAFGQLGNNLTVNLSSPVQVGTVAEWASVSTGDNSTAAIKVNGTLWTWGTGSYGALGLGDSVSRSSPTQVGTLSDWVQVSAGWQATAAIKADGTLWTWGRNNGGRLGHNEATTNHRSSPSQVGGLKDWKEVVVGNDHIVALKNDRTLWTWGYGATGRLGQNDTVSRSSPTQLGNDTDWESISAEYHSFAVKTNGTLWGWGVGTFGRIGAGDATDRSSPTQIGTLTNWTHASAGSRHSIALKTDGTLWGWGYNLVGQVGDNSAVSRSSPVQVGALTTWAQISAKGGADSAGANDLRLGLSIALKNDGTLWSWGENNGGRLGNQGDSPDTNVSSPGQVGTLKTWRSISAGGAHGAAIQLPTSTTYEDLPLSVVFVDEDGTTGTNTISGLALGTAAPNRYIVAAISLNNNSRTVTAVTIGGHSATEIGTMVSGTGSPFTQVWLWIAAVPNGTTGAVVKTGNDSENWFVALWAVYGITSSTPYDTASATGTDPSTTACDIPANGIAIAYARGGTAYGAWTIPTPGAEEFDAGHPGGMEDVNQYQHSGASGVYASAVTGGTFTADGNATNAVLRVVSFA